MSKATYTIKPLLFGSFTAYEKSIIHFFKGYGEKIVTPSIGYLIEGNNKKFLVDTGPGVHDAMHALHPLIAIDFPEEQNVVNVLAKLGLKPTDLDAVIWTHLHWDHCWNGEKFPGVPIYVQQSEVDYALHPLPMHGNVYESPACGMTPPWINVVSQMKMIDGDYAFDDGIDLLLTPGHTPGGQCVLVNTTEGEYLIAGDTIMQYENWENHTYSAAHVNLMDFEASYQRIAKMDLAGILPGHDWAVFDHPVYPFEK